MTTIQDRMEILELNARYNWACYDRDPDAYAACFIEEGVYESGNTGACNEGHTALAAGLATARDSPWLMGHVTADALIEVDGNVARQRVFVLLYRRENSFGDNEFFATGTYTDQLVRTPDGWRYRHRRSFIDRSRLPWGNYFQAWADSPLSG